MAQTQASGLDPMSQAPIAQASAFVYPPWRSPSGSPLPMLRQRQ